MAVLRLFVAGQAAMNVVAQVITHTHGVGGGNLAISNVNHGRVDITDHNRHNTITRINSK